MQDQPAPSDNAYALTNANAPTPTTNEPYLQISGNYNSIYINPCFSDFASLPGYHYPWLVVPRCGIELIPVVA